MGGLTFKVIAASDNTVDDFKILIDLNANGYIKADKVSLITYGKQVLAIE